jgi:hypothetical protein
LFNPGSYRQDRARRTFYGCFQPADPSLTCISSMFASIKPPRTRRLGVVIAALASVLIAFAACDNPLAALPEEGVPDVLEYSSGGFGADSRSVELRGDTVVYRRTPWGHSVPSIVTARVPTADEWRRFWAAAEKAGVGRWRRRYVAENVVDGSGWGLRLQAGGETIVSEGSNAYPDRSGREHENEVTDAFFEFVDALGDLAGQSVR